MPSLPATRVISVNVARASDRLISGRRVLTAIGKRPVAGPVEVRPLGLDGDEQADPSVHGGLTKAVYAYPAEHHAFWRTVRAQAGVAGWDDTVPPGAFGENLTITGVLEQDLYIGDRLRFPGCVLAVSEPRFPCFKFNAAMGFTQAARLMAQSGFCGAYLAVVEPGTIESGQAFEIEPGPRDVGIRELFRSRVKA